MRLGKVVDLAGMRPPKPERKTKLSGLAYGTPFGEMAKLEPRLWRLLHEIRFIHGVDYESCPVNRWYGYSDRKSALKPRLKKLAGSDNAAFWTAADYLYGQLKVCLHCLGRPLTEADLEADLVARLRIVGGSNGLSKADIQTQVSTRFGRADIVTPNMVYEVKLALSRTAIYQAIGQARVYALALGRPRIGIAGQLTAETHRLAPALKELGVTLETWDYAGAAKARLTTLG